MTRPRHTSTVPRGKSPLPLWERPAFLAFLLVALTFIAYLPILKAGYIWDDDQYVTENKLLSNGPGLGHIWFNVGSTSQYYPMVYTVFWIAHHLWGLNPVGYHVINVLIHVMNAFLLWRLLAGLKLPGAWLVAAIFAVHPIEVESVGWVTELKNCLSGFFYFLSALAYLRFSPIEPAPGARRNLSWYWAALLLFAAALLSKTVTCSLPAAILLVIYWKRGRLQKSNLLPLLPFFVIGLAAGSLTSWIEQHFVGAHGPQWAISFPDRCLIAGRALCFYAGKIFWPASQTFIYPHWDLDTHALWQWLFPVSVIACLSTLWLARGKIGRGPFVAVAFYAGTLFPALGFTNVYPMRFSFVADHFQYLAGIGLITLFACGVSAGIKSFKLPSCSIALPLLVVLTVLSNIRTRAYETPEILWRDTLRKNPACWMAETNLGNLLARRGNLAEAYQHFESALRIRETDSDAQYNYGSTLVQHGQLDLGLAHLQRAAELQPDSFNIRCNLGIALAQKGNTQEAIIQLEKAVSLSPQNPSGYVDLATAFMVAGRTDDAIATIQKSLALNPQDATSQKLLETLKARKAAGQ